MNSAMPLPFLLCCGTSVKEENTKMSYSRHKHIKGKESPFIPITVSPLTHGLVWGNFIFAKIFQINNTNWQ
jgi:hypothetical protein